MEFGIVGSLTNWKAFLKPSLASQLGARSEAVAEVAETFGDSDWYVPKLLASSATGNAWDLGNCFLWAMLINGREK